MPNSGILFAYCFLLLEILPTRNAINAMYTYASTTHPLGTTVFTRTTMPSQITAPAKTSNAITIGTAIAKTRIFFSCTFLSVTFVVSAVFSNFVISISSLYTVFNHFYSYYTTFSLLLQYIMFILYAIFKYTFSMFQ